MAYWLLKTEPTTFGIDHLAHNAVEHWDGVRNYTARNNLMAMQKGERVFIYHSSVPQPGVAGIGEIVREAYPDHTAFDPSSKYYDPGSTPEKPRWFMPDVAFVCKFAELIDLKTLRVTPGLEDMTLLRKGMRLSVQPVSDAEWKIICGLAGVKP